MKKHIFQLATGYLLLSLSGCTTDTGRPISKFINTAEIVRSKDFNLVEVDSSFVRRIRAGLYEGYQVDLCIDDSTRCNLPEFAQYKKPAGYSMTLHLKDWNGYPEIVKKEVLNEIVYYTWGNVKKPYNALSVTFPDGTSPFSMLSSNSAERLMTFARPDFLKGGAGSKAYGPNCWYNAIASIVDSNAKFGQRNEITSSFGSKPRFLGPTEFRYYMKNFTRVDTPQFGDIIRYYADSAYYDESINLYNGEVHAAVYIGEDSVNGRKQVALTKNGRNDLSFLLFQDVKGLDTTYLRDGKSPIHKGFFRVKKGSTFKDPSICGKCSDANEAYAIDSLNYHNRWDCLAGVIKADTCNGTADCACFPRTWIAKDFK